MSKRGRKTKYNSDEIEVDLSHLILRRDRLKLQRQIDHVDRQLNGQESKLAIPDEEEVEINKQILRLRSAISIRKQ